MGINSLSPWPTPRSQPLTAAHLFYVSANSGHFIHTKNTVYNTWSFTTGFFHKHTVFKIYPCCRMCQYFLAFWGWMVHIVHVLWICSIWFLPAYFGRLLGCFHLLPVENSASRNVCTQVLVWTPLVNSLACTPRSGLAWSYCIMTIDNIYK